MSRDIYTCPNCGAEGAFFDGTCYFCPDCDYEWDDDSTNGEEGYEGDDEDY